MANLSNLVDLTASPESQFDPLPSGDYPVVIVESEVKTTKRGDGQYLELQMQVMSGPYSGRTLWSRVTLSNPNATATQIGQQQLAQLRHATGVMQLSDSQQLHSIPVQARVEHVKADPAKHRDRDGNEIRSFKALAGAPAVQQVAATQKPAANTQAGGLPWQRAG